MEIIGLKRVRKQLDKAIENQLLPHSFGLIGEEGSGKHTLLADINSRYFDCDYLDISDSQDELDQLYTLPQKRLYVLDFQRITQAEQNRILKLLEEPYDNVYVCVLARNISNLIPTVRNRLVIYTLDSYSLEELRGFAEKEGISIENEYLCNIVMTPGDVLRVRSVNADLKAIDELAQKVVNSIGRASYPNTLSILDKINFKDEYDKLDFSFFLKFLHLNYLKSYIINPSDTLDLCAREVHELRVRLAKDSRLDTKKAMAVCLTELWRISRGTQRTQG